MSNVQSVSVSESNLAASIASVVASSSENEGKKEKKAKTGIKRPRIAFNPAANHLFATKESVEYLCGLVDAHQKATRKPLSVKAATVAVCGRDLSGVLAHVLRAAQSTGMAKEYQLTGGPSGGLSNTGLPLDQSSRDDSFEEVDLTDSFCEEVEQHLRKLLLKSQKKGLDTTMAVIQFASDAWESEEGNDFDAITPDEIRTVVVRSQKNTGNRPSFEFKKGKGLVFVQRKIENPVAEDIAAE